MYYTRHQTESGPAWALEGLSLRAGLSLSSLLSLTKAEMARLLEALPASGELEGPLLPPVDPMQEIWAAGVTYLRSRDARQLESQAADVYARVYGAERPEIFHKAAGWRAVGSGVPVRIRGDSAWNVPEPEMVLVINRHGEIVGYTAGNDMSSRDIEGENPLYLPQAKIYDGACALGPGILLAEPGDLGDLPVRLEIVRSGTMAFSGDTRTSRMARSLEELASYLTRELSFPHGVFLMTGTGIVPPDDFSLHPGDLIRVTVGVLTVENPVIG